MKFKILKQEVEIAEVEIAHLRERYLRNYNVFTDMMTDMMAKVRDEELCMKLLCIEKVGKNRENIIYRLHTLINQLRREREQESLGL
jgi:hypothetical protein